MIRVARGGTGRPGARVAPGAEALDAPPDAVTGHGRSLRRVRVASRSKDLAQRYAVIGAWIVMLLIFTVIEPGKMLRLPVYQSIFGSQVDLVFPALGAVVTFVVGEFDLSVAFIMGLCATVLTVLVVLQDMNVMLACLVVLGIGIGCGLLNAVFVVGLRVNGLIVTLGSGTVFLGLAILISNAQSLSGLSESFSRIDLYRVAGLPISFFYGVIAAGALAYVITLTPLGRHMTFVGASREVARLAGVRVDRIRFGSYVVSGFFCAIGGILVAASLGGFDAPTSANYLLPTLSALFLGTAIVKPGSFNPVGTMIGIYFLATGIMGFELMGLGGWIEDIFYGAVLVVAVAIAGIVRREKGS